MITSFEEILETLESLKEKSKKRKDLFFDCPKIVLELILREKYQIKFIKTESSSFSLIKNVHLELLTNCLLLSKFYCKISFICLK